MDNDIKKLINMTTIVKVDDNESRKTIFGDKYMVSRFQGSHGQQIDLIDLEQNWKNKLESFGNSWNEKRQNYRFLQDSFKFFYFSFEQLKYNKVSCINKLSDNRSQALHLNELTGVNLYGMYYHGKKCIDLLVALKLINNGDKSYKFTEKFSETRNKFIEHNHNPRRLKLKVDPSIWSLGDTTSFLEVYIHESNSERAYDAYIDYYEDYYKLEEIITKIIETF